jgi:hypothetical protein
MARGTDNGIRRKQDKIILQRPAILGRDQSAELKHQTLGGIRCLTTENDLLVWAKNGLPTTLPARICSAMRIMAKTTAASRMAIRSLPPRRWRKRGKSADFTSFDSGKFPSNGEPIGPGG